MEEHIVDEVEVLQRLLFLDWGEEVAAVCDLVIVAVGDIDIVLLRERPAGYSGRGEASY